MKVLGVVLELNPFHNGHKYFLTQAHEKVKPDITIAIMSGNFSMRGEVMVIDKWTRSQILLNNGVDIVLELPFLSTVSSADYFSYNAINILNHLQITDLCFGVELNNLDQLLTIKKILESELYQNKIKSFLAHGHSYQTSSYKVIKEITNDQEIIANCTLPNNTLAIGYLKAIDNLNQNIKCILIKRISNNYYDEEITDEKINSATTLRKLISQNIDIKQYTPNIDYPYFNPLEINQNILNLLKYVFSINDIKTFQQYYGISEGIENRINNFIFKAQNYEELIKLIQTRRYPANRIKRLLLHILLQIPKTYENQYHHYLRILAMNQKGIDYINSLPKVIKKQIITTFKNQDHYLIDIELKASKLYSLLTNQPQLYLQEYNVPYLEEKDDH